MKKIILGLTVVTAIVLFLGVHTAKAQTSTTDTTSTISMIDMRPVSFFERIKLRFVFKQEKKVEILKEFSQRDFAAAQKKLSEGKEAEATALLKKSDEHLLHATESVSRIRDAVKQQKALDTISATVSTRTTVLSEVKDKIQNPVAKEAIERAIIRHADDANAVDMKIKERINDLKTKAKNSDDSKKKEKDIDAKDLSAAVASTTQTKSTTSSGYCSGGTSASMISVVKNTAYPNQTVVPNTTHFKIASYKVKNNCTESIVLTGLNIGAGIVGTNSANFTNVEARINGVLQGVHPTLYPFAINYVITSMQTITVDFYANIGPATSGSIQTGMWVSGTGLSSGTSYSSNTASGQLITIGASSIIATVDASAPVASIVHDNQTIPSAAFKFAAVNSAYNVTDLTLTIPQSGATVAQSVMIYDGSTLIATQPGATTINFTGLSWNVPANATKVLTVKLQLGAVGIGAGSTGAKLLTTLTNFTATNMSSGVSAAGTENNPAGNLIYAYAAIPTITNMELASNNLIPGSQMISKFTISPTGGNIGWKKLSWTISRSMGGVDTLSTPTLWDVDSNTQIPGVATFTGSVNTDNDISGGITFVATNEQQLSGTKMYVLKVMTAFTPATGDYLSTSIQQPSTYMSSNTYPNIGGTSTSFVWSDISAANHNISTLDWTGSYLVRNLPTSAQTLFVN